MTINSMAITLRNSDKQRIALSAPAKVGTTWNTVSPAAFNAPQYVLGSPAEVVTT